MENTTAASEISNSAKGQKNKKGKKINPSFKSKRYRDKLRTEVKTLESLVPVNRTTLHKKLDSQTVYRLAIAYLRVKTVLTGLYNTKYACTTEEGDGMPVTECIGTDEGRFEPGKLGDTWPFDRHTLYQILEGFIIVVSADGTLMFVSENVSQYTGFNQVDVLHRCMYGLIHPDDQLIVKEVLENNHIHHRQYAHPTTSLSSEGTVEHLSFFCRIKCYHGNTAEPTNCGGNTVAYTKFHCTGTLRSIPELPHSNKTSTIVAILYCRPFYITGNDVHDSSNVIFWSKHDLDLTFQDIEDRGCHILGSSSKELSGRTLYQLVHPEDLPILVHIHTAVTSCSEVQTFRFRIQAKNGNWIWLQSKGKVVSKNSKKYSIIFTHCPVRDEEDEFLQEESVIRRTRFVDYISSVASCSQDLSVGNNRYQTIYGRNRLQHGQFTTQEQPDGFSCHYVNSNESIPNYSVCPSSWHMDKDRHSPILPSSQVANKAFMKDRFFRLNEQHRIRHVEEDPTRSSSKCCHDSGNKTPHLPDMASRPDIIPYPSFMVNSLHCNNFQNLHNKRNSANISDFPYNPTNWYAFDNITEIPCNVPMRYHPYRGTLLYPQGLDNTCKETNYFQRFANQQRQNIYSSANIKFSMVCDTNISVDKRLHHGNTPESPHFPPSMFNHDVEHMGHRTVVKPEPDDQSCAFQENLEMTEKRTPGVKYDVEASVYMRIVESQNSGFGKEMSPLGGWQNMLYN